ncbi:MAG: hypothetical protein KME31_16145 [Tolypothrix carrinoi HA7290-LM1]|nr:hypothetical protein [Tolypothrix carrinoi HA7290-LM1]
MGNGEWGIGHRAGGRGQGRQGRQGGAGGQLPRSQLPMPNDGRCASAGKPVQRTASPMPIAIGPIAPINFWYSLPSRSGLPHKLLSKAQAL